ncbi:MAG: hypothetical protein FWG26_04675 [Betaproteobacteria bacterium]|nr:hypothetical protein [Betaproteobacteria bacterium]
MLATSKKVIRFFAFVFRVILLAYTGYFLMTFGGVILLDGSGGKAHKIVLLAFITLALFLLFHGLMAYKSAKFLAKCRGKMVFEILKRGVFVLFVLSLVFVGMIYSFNKKVSYFECEITPKEFQERMYLTETCIMRGGVGEHDYPTRLRILNEKEKLLATRYYLYHQIGYDDKPFEYLNDGLYYFNSKGNKETLYIPPSKWDWLLARIPFTSIGQFEVLWYENLGFEVFWYIRILLVSVFFLLIFVIYYSYRLYKFMKSEIPKN